MIKIIAGLGRIAHPFDIEGQASMTSVIDSAFFGTTDAHIVVDHVGLSVLGNAGNPSISNMLLRSGPASGPSPVSSNPTQLSAPPVITVTPQTTPQKYSQESGKATYDTLFHEFNIDCYPTYNFWVADEETNDIESSGDRKLEDIPRFIRVVWDVALDLVPPGRRLAPSKNHRDVSPGSFGSGPEKEKSITYRGIIFSPDHLNNFSLVKQNIANGYAAPGTVHAIVELPYNTSALGDPVVSTEPYAHVDEDAFLQHPDFDGVSLEELRSNVHSLTNGVLYAGKLASETISANGNSDQHDLFAGKFSIEKPPVNGGFMNIKGISSAGGPPLGFQVRTPLTTEQNTVPTDPLLDLIEKVTAPMPSIPDDDASRIKVRFVYPSLGGLLDPSKVNTMQSPEHAENVAALAQFLPNLEVMNAAAMQNKQRPTDVPSFPSPSNTPFLEYVGYVLEKYERSSSGMFVLKETIDLPHREYGEYIDSRIKYSGIYRYRVKAVLRVTHPAYGRTQIYTRHETTYESSYWSGEWSKTWAYGIVIDVVPPSPPDEMTVRSDSSRKRIVVSFKLPTNEQRDIYYMRLFRKIQDQNGTDLTGWVQVGDDWGPENVLFIDTDVDFYQNNRKRYVYAAQTVTRHNEYSPLSDQLGARLNKEFMTYGEYPISFISQYGVRLECHGAFGVHPYRRFYTEVVVPNDMPFRFSGREALGNIALDGNQYFVRIVSLDTGEQQTFPIRISYNNQATVVDRKTLAISVRGSKGFKDLDIPDDSVPMPPPVFRNWLPTTTLPRNATTFQAQSNQKNFGPGSLK